MQLVISRAKVIKNLVHAYLYIERAHFVGMESRPWDNSRMNSGYNKSICRSLVKIRENRI